MTLARYQRLEQILFHISDHIPACIISSKDFESLHSKAKFASILSCVLGLETINHRPHYNDAESNKLGCVGYQHLLADSHYLKHSSKLLHNVLENLQTQNYVDIVTEEKYTSDKEILIGLTVDYRHLENWHSFKGNTEPIIRDMIQKSGTWIIMLYLCTLFFIVDSDETEQERRILDWDIFR
jgi:hypothetical protein